jgi:hypothetical protein
MAPPKTSFALQQARGGMIREAIRSALERGAGQFADAVTRAIIEAMLAPSQGPQSQGLSLPSGLAPSNIGMDQVLAAMLSNPQVAMGLYQSMMQQGQRPSSVSTSGGDGGGGAIPNTSQMAKLLKIMRAVRPWDSLTTSPPDLMRG